MEIQRRETATYSYMGYFPHVAIACYYLKKYFLKMLSTVLFLDEKKLLKVLKSSPVMIIRFHKIPFYHLNKRIL